MLRFMSLWAVLSGRSVPIPKERVDVTQKYRAGSVQPGRAGMNDLGSSINGDHLNRHVRDPTPPDSSDVHGLRELPVRSIGWNRAQLA
jgi:hypothetical protein